LQSILKAMQMVIKQKDQI